MAVLMLFLSSSVVFVSFCSFCELISCHLFPHRCEEGLVGPRSVVGEEEDVAAENPLDVGQIRHPGRRQAAVHAAAQAAAPAAAQHEAHEGQGQLLRPRLQGRVGHLQNLQ